MKNALLLFKFMVLAPLVSCAQSNAENIQRGAIEMESRRSQTSNSAPTQSYGRYNQYGDYIPGSHPGDTPYNTYPGPLAGKRKLTAWRAYRDDYKVRKERQKEARREYRRTH